MELIFIRHFPTKGNRLKQYIGKTDESLDESMVSDMIRAASKEWMGENSVEFVVASPMKRCLQTARLLFPDKEILICPEMRECDFGSFEGETYEELKDLPDYKRWLESGGMTAFPGGESREAFVSRCVDGMERIVDELFSRKCACAAFVVHGGTIMSVLSAFDEEKRGFYQWQVANGGGYQAHVEERAWQQGQKGFTEIRRL